MSANETNGCAEIEDGFGGFWLTCGTNCDLEVVRPGKVQCNYGSFSCPNREESIEAADGVADAGAIAGALEADAGGDVAERVTYRRGDIADVEGRRAVYMPTRWEWLDGTWTAIPLSVGPVLGNVYDIAPAVAQPRTGLVVGLVVEPGQ